MNQKNSKLIHFSHQSSWSLPAFFLFDSPLHFQGDYPSKLKKWQVMQLHKYVYMLETLQVLKVVPCHLVSAAHVDFMFVLRKKPRTSSLL